MRRPGAPWTLAAALSLASLAAVAAAPLSAATTVTLPAASSIVGLAPFYSDVRAFNTSYTETLDVTLIYRCFLGDCPAVAPAVQMQLGPRESAGFDDIVRSAFFSPDTAGGVEFVFDGAAEQLVITSRLYSTAPTPTVGMFIPGLDASQAYSQSVLTSVRNGGPGEGFRTNVGVFNPGIASVSVAFRVFVGAAQQGAPVVRSVGPHSGVQVNAIFAAADVGDLQTANAVIAVDATGPVFSYAAVIDNATMDPYLVVGALDRAATPTLTPTGGTPTFTPSPTLTPTATSTPTVTGTPPTSTPTGSPTLTATPTTTPSVTPGLLTPTFTPSLTLTPTVTRTATPNPNRVVLVGTNAIGQGTGMNFWDTVEHGFVSTIPLGQTVEWQWVAQSGPHSTTSGNCVPAPCTPDFTWDSAIHQAPFSYTHTFNTPGTFNYYCQIHGDVMQGVVNVLAPP